MVERHAELGKIVKKILHEDVDRKHRQERQEDACYEDREHVAEVAAYGHLQILGHVGECASAFDDALIQYHEVFLKEDDVGNFFRDVDGVIN